MSTVELTDNEWGQVWDCMSYAPARQCNALMNKMGAQVQAQALAKTSPQDIKVEGNGQEVSHAER